MILDVSDDSDQNGSISVGYIYKRFNFKDHNGGLGLSCVI